MRKKIFDNKQECIEFMTDLMLALTLEHKISKTTIFHWLSGTSTQNQNDEHKNDVKKLRKLFYKCLDPNDSHMVNEKILNKFHMTSDMIPNYKNIFDQYKQIKSALFALNIQDTNFVSNILDCHKNFTSTKEFQKIEELWKERLFEPIWEQMHINYNCIFFIKTYFAQISREKYRIYFLFPLWMMLYFELPQDNMAFSFDITKKEFIGCATNEDILKQLQTPTKQNALETIGKLEKNSSALHKEHFGTIKKVLQQPDFIIGGPFIEIPQENPFYQSEESAFMERIFTAGLFVLDGQWEKAHQVADHQIYATKYANTNKIT